MDKRIRVKINNRMKKYEFRIELYHVGYSDVTEAEFLKQMSDKGWKFVSATTLIYNGLQNSVKDLYFKKLIVK